MHSRSILFKTVGSGKPNCSALIVVLLVAVESLLFTIPARAVLYTFTQTGFVGGGSISGSFSFDQTLVSGGVIHLSDLDTFQLNWSSGNSPVSSFSLGKNDLIIFAFHYPAKGSAVWNSADDGIVASGESPDGSKSFFYSAGLGSAGGVVGEESPVRSGNVRQSATEDAVQVPDGGATVLYLLLGACSVMVGSAWKLRREVVW